MLNVEKELLELINKRHDIVFKSLNDEFRGEYNGYVETLIVNNYVDALLLSDDLKVIKPKLIVDWKKVPVDTKVVVWDNFSYQNKKYFNYLQSNNLFNCWEFGRTSFTASNTTAWDCCELHESEIERGIEEGWCRYE